MRVGVWHRSVVVIRRVRRAEIRAGWLGHRDAPARGRSARRLSPRAPHRASRLRATYRPRRAGADRDHQLLVRCIRARRRVRLPSAARDHRRLLRPRTRRLVRTRRPARRLRRALLLSRALVANLRDSGLSVTTGTVNHAAILAPLLPLGLDAITSDAPHLARSAQPSARDRGACCLSPHAHAHAQRLVNSAMGSSARDGRAVRAESADVGDASE